MEGVPDSVTENLISARDNQETLMLAAWCQFVIAYPGMQCAANGIVAAVVQLGKDACITVLGKNCPAKVFDTVLKWSVSTESFFGVHHIRVIISKWAHQQSVLILNSAAGVTIGGDTIITGTKQQDNLSGGGDSTKRKGSFHNTTKKSHRGSRPLTISPPSKKAGRQPFVGRNRTLPLKNLLYMRKKGGKGKR